MNLGMLLNAPYPADMRVKKETDALINAGFRIYLLCLRKAGEKYEEEFNGIHITRIDAGKNNYQLALRDAWMSVTFIHPEFAKAIPPWVKKNALTVIHVHDLPLAGTALALREKLSVKVVVDLHENYPEALRTWFEWKRGFLVKMKNKLFMDPDRWSKHEHTAVVKSDFVIAVVDEMKQRLIEKHSIDEKKVIVVSNTEDKSFLNQPVDTSVYQNVKQKFRIVYSGGIGPHRGVDTAIEAMQYIKSYPDITLVIIGSGSNDVINHLKMLSRQLGVDQQVHFLGHQSFHKFYAFMHLADANIIPHKSNAHTDNTVPHKLFQAMMAGKPVIVSSSAPLKRIVSRTRSGIIFEAGDAKDLSEKIVALYNNKQLQQELGANGVKATVAGELNWENEQKKLVGFYASLMSRQTSLT